MKGLIGLIVVACALVAVFPLGVIWSLNTLFNLGIPFTYKTWGAALILSATVGGYGSSGGRR